MASSVSNADSSQVMFVLIVFTIFLVTSALCFCCSVFRWRRNRRSRQETRLRAQIMHYNRRVAAVAAASMEQMSKEDEHDAAMRLQVLQVMFPEPKIDCTHLVYDCESKRYAWSNDEEKTVTADTCCSICLETCGTYLIGVLFVRHALGRHPSTHPSVRFANNLTVCCSRFLTPHRSLFLKSPLF
mmetsp:Transcript_18116/g.30013  ORF Transcript_18116/g.30013 Transcript_18116/m.30013 type:complete len:185 (+) Transcript_18116:150-704(+)